MKRLAMGLYFKWYGRWRWRENLAVLGFTDFLGRMFSNHWLPLILIRRLGLRLLFNIQPLKRLALKFMTGLSGHAPKVAQRQVNQAAVLASD